MNRQELIKQAFVEAWNGYIAAMKDIRGVTDIPMITRAQIILSANLSPMAAQIYRQLSSVTYIKVPPEINEATQQLLAQVLEASGVNFVIMPDEIETIPTEKDT